MSQAQHGDARQNGSDRRRKQVEDEKAARRMQQYGGQQLLAQPAQYFDELTDTDVDDNTVTLLQNLFTQDLMLGKLTEADVHEARWIARNIIEFVYAEHPDTRSTFTGNRRKMLSGDYSNGLKPLNGLQNAWIEMSVFNFIAIISRSLGGFQQEQFSKQYNVMERRESENETGGGIRGLLPGGGH